MHEQIGCMSEHSVCDLQLAERLPMFELKKAMIGENSNYWLKITQTLHFYNFNLITASGKCFFFLCKKILKRSNWYTQSCYILFLTLLIFFQGRFQLKLWLILINWSNHNIRIVIMAPQVEHLFSLDSRPLKKHWLTTFQMKNTWENFFRSWVYLLRLKYTTILPLCNNTIHHYMPLLCLLNGVCPK